MKISRSILLIIIAFLVIKKANSQTLSKETIIISTSYGNMKFKLFEETPLHKANFLKLVKQGFYDSLLFHRVIENFMIQGGDPYSKHARSGVLLGDSDLHYMVPAEFNPKLFHKKGMLCAARESDDKNPEKASSACQFYIVQGKKLDDKALQAYEYRINKDILAKITNEVMLNNEEAKKIKEKIVSFEQQGLTDSVKTESKKLDDLIKSIYAKSEHYQFSPEQIEAYKTIGGTPHLDGSYTVFGQIVEGLEILDKIAAEPTDRNNRPLTDIRMKIWIE